ncbi:MAG: bacillithiol biosynthesis deacetylase BshB1, partial [Planctomycetales bacterium]
LAGVIRQTRPRWLFAPHWTDAHPDHVAATQLAEAARFWSKLSKSDLPGEPFHPPRILYYFCVHLRLAIQPAFILDVSEQWESKLRAISCYHSQFIAGRPQEPPTFLDRLRDACAHCGYLIGTEYGEPFASREPVALGSLRDLL